MGEARRRGSYERRRDAAIKRSKTLLVEKLGGRDEERDSSLRAGLNAFLSQLSGEEWKERRALIIQRLNAATKVTEQRVALSSAASVRDRDDEIGWYLFLCEQALEDPLCMQVNQAARALPFFTAIGERWPHAARVLNLNKKIKHALHAGKKDPDGFIFEILVALSYAANGWNVELIRETPLSKTPDMVVSKEEKELYVECKRQSRSAAYAAEERNDFLLLWNPCVDVLTQNRQWIWLKCVFHEEVSKIDGNFLRDLLQATLPLKAGEQLLHDSMTATVNARLIDRRAVSDHLKKFRVKSDSPMIAKLLGGDWAPVNSATTVAHLIRTSHVTGCEVPALGTYVEEIAWASGITREFDSDVSIEKKARDVRNLLADAVRQLPDHEPSVIHIAVESDETVNVEKRRTAKVMQSIPAFVTDKPVLAVRLHLLRANQTIEQLFDFDETVETFQIDGADLSGIPSRVVVPISAAMMPGRHWEISR